MCRVRLEEDWKALGSEQGFGARSEEAFQGLGEDLVERFEGHCACF